MGDRLRRRLLEAGTLDEEETDDTQRTSKYRPRKSGHVKMATELVRPEVPRRHHHIFRLKACERTPASYGQLTISEFGFGFCQSMLQEHDPDTRQLMLKYIATLFKDATISPWDAIMVCHASVLL